MVFLFFANRCRVRSVDVLGCCFCLETHQLHHRNPYLEICRQQHMGYKPPNSYGVWDMESKSLQTNLGNVKMYVV